jgi:PAS domain S-box-containing protein
MNSFKDLSVKTKMLIGYGSIISIVTFFAIFVIIEMNEFKTDLIQVELEQEATLTAKELHTNILNIQQFITDACLTNDNSSLVNAKEHYNKAILVHDNFLSIKTWDAQTISELRNIKEELTVLLNAGNEMFDVYKINTSDGNLKMKEFDKVNLTLIDRVTGISKRLDTSMHASRNELDQMTDSNIQYTIIFMLFAGFLSILIATISIKWFTKVIKILTEAAVKIASGETNVTVNIDSNDEFGKLADAFNIMVEKISLQIQYLDNIPSPVMVIDKEYNIQYMNKMGATVLAKSQTELTGKKCYDQFKTSHCRTENCALTKAMAQDKIVTAETIAKPNGSELPILYTGASVKNKSGQIVGALETVTDISDIKKMQNYLSRSTNNLLIAMDKFSTGDLTIEVEPEIESDAIGKLFIGFNKSVQNIKNIVENVNEAVQATASASTQISSSTEEMAAGAQEQSSQTLEVAGAVEQMAKTIIETTKNSALASDAAKNAGEVAKEGGKVVSETVQGMNRISNVVKESAEIVQTLGSNSNKIGEIVQVIDDIADQTNLLALNAAIEAARAGEQGRGFAVVADEVRKLAERTTKATKEIAEMIKQIQRDTEAAVVSMRAGTSEVEKGKILADKAGQSLKQIIASADEVVDMVTQVAAASEEQSSAAEQISKNIESISSVTEESASGIQQIARAAEDLNRLTVNLQELVSHFTLMNDNSNTNYNRKQLSDSRGQFGSRASGKLVAH